MELHEPTHVVLLSSPGLGHLMPVIELGKRQVLHHSFKVTILAVTSQTSRTDMQILNSVLTPSLCRIINIPSPDLNGIVDEKDCMVTRLCIMMRKAVSKCHHALE
ncbi:hypothetical protein AAZX31_12G153700 [Glycine max]|uniref:Anthocyanidin 3-O-glucosyltransferase 5 n=1 Tax=Glycine soja TaxID=3848 RepID=A0A445HR58_GLYSO|nr:hypothetical protein GYH30_033951 [Glycine max]RZB76152.1 Anthocyanidin 3-O-glucosyltransferase 5 [Glycine soja]